jgi:glycosyltransferase involved in cell wall biosynthesis
MTKNLLIEGWRGINHSYSLVNQYQLLELNKKDLSLYHHDVLPYRAEWNSEKNFAGFDQDSVDLISKISDLPQNISPDVTYRISFPYNFTSIDIGELFVFGTSEHQVIIEDMVYGKNRIVQYKNAPLKVITPSNWSKKGFLNAGLRHEQIEVIPHGVDLSIFRPLDSDLRADYRDMVGANKDNFVILVIGAMTENKGVDILLDAYIQLKLKHPQILLVLKDQSNLYQFTARDLVQLYCRQRGIDLTSSVISQALSDIVLVSENLNFTQLNGLYNAADCYVSPYRAEGFNLPPMEAAAAGTPIIVTKGGSTDDYVDPSFALQIESKKIFKDGKYFLEPNLDSLVEKIESLIFKKNLELNSVNARLFLESNFSWSKVTDKLSNLFFRK